jgi:hypothetical protein
MPPTRLGNANLLLLLLVLVVAGAARAWYLCACAENAQNSGPIQVQTGSATLNHAAAGEKRQMQPPTDLDALVSNLSENQWYGNLAPLAAGEEKTAHAAPGYPWLLYWIERLPLSIGPLDRTMRWLQCGLGTLTAAFYFLFALRGFRHWLIAALAGLLCAVTRSGWRVRRRSMMAR